MPMTEAEAVEESIGLLPAVAVEPGSPYLVMSWRLTYKLAGNLQEYNMSWQGRL